MKYPRTVLFAVHTVPRVNFMLRTSLFSQLKQQGVHIVLVAPFVNEKKFRNEFLGSGVTAISVVPPGKWTHLVASLRALALMSSHPTLQKTKYIKEKITRRFLKPPPVRALAGYLFRSIVLALLPVSKRQSSVFWDRLAYWTLLPHMGKDIVRKARPDAIIVGTTGAEVRDLPFVLAGSVNKIPVIAVDHNLDVPEYRYFGVPWGRAYYACFGEPQKKEFAELQEIPERQLSVTGALRYDRYFGKTYVKQSRADFWSSRGLDPTRPVVLLGAKDPRAFPHNGDIINIYKTAIKNGKLKDVQLYVRFDPRHDPARYGSLLSGVHYERAEEHFDPDHIANLLHHSDIYIGLGASTLALEALSVGTPALWVGFDGYTKYENPEDSIALQYTLPLWQRILRTGGIEVISSAEELIEKTTAYLNNRNLNSDKRQRLLVQEYANRRGDSASSRILTLIERLVQ